jgi:hypothetical protein
MPRPQIWPGDGKEGFDWPLSAREFLEHNFPLNPPEVAEASTLMESQNAAYVIRFHLVSIILIVSEIFRLQERL